ncbi:MAG: dinitrogenase iron-molybdenum cofactor biosynthesis protein [Spirochaetes bacterium GWF1_41_5]|nr:MAG: dinitrogenase iron-molybdenum cofactor biosynthesis protein [Spirochaetes bacterium GWF1_41_5]HBE04356.1 dinitrogenase iron-molybdenum cofactor biosynthesis protein [Spirochaetia bacterium]
MKICITSQGNNFESQIDPRFGRCAFFIIIDPDTSDFEAIKNTSAESAGGAGIQSGKFIADKQVKSVITGNVGPNAFQTLNAAGIEIITGVSGLVKDAIKKYKRGELKSTNSANVQSHFGMKGSQNA